MSGTNQSGRLPKSAAMHKMAGTYRGDRHGAGTAEKVKGEPIMPVGLSRDERWLWNSVSNAYRGRGVLAELDTAALLSACELWALYRQAVKVAKKAPTDKDARIATTSYYASFERAAARLGLNPCDRARLNIPTVLSSDPISELLAKKYFSRIVG